MTEAIKTQPAKTEQHFSATAKEMNLEKPSLQESKKLEDIRKRIEKQATSTEAIIDKEELVEEKTEEENEQLLGAASQAYVSHNFKEMAYRRSVKQLRRALPAGYKLLSYVFNPAWADSFFESVAKTAGRPSALIGAASFLAGGSIALVFVSESRSRDFGILAYILLAVGGLLSGWLLEKTFRLFKA